MALGGRVATEMGKRMAKMNPMKYMQNTSALGVAFDAFIGYSAYSEAKEQGDSTGWAATKGASEIAMLKLMSVPLYLGYEAASNLPGLAAKGITQLGIMSRANANPYPGRAFGNAAYFDSQQNYTMRQAGMQLAKASKYNRQQAMLGNEAQYLHM